ncbi:MAG: addiction module antitoxin RelB [Dehalococcoidia bacterium]|nr:addiction module antitoxin RelB [Dehalococcoidia bacterium]
MSIDELELEALSLDPRLRARLAEKLLQSLEQLSDAENERLRAEEALRRNAELDAGTANARSAEEVFRDARASLLR